MISSLFKFFPRREDFFDNFLLRASNRTALNDPFEATPSFEYWADICFETGYTRFGKTRDEIIKYLEVQKENSIWAELGISLFRENGIISLTETKDNLLLWAHYAEQHKGMVVEFDLFDDFFNSTHTHKGNPFIGKVQRVLYRKKRLAYVNNFLMEPYFHKSEEWAYEKEHRLLLSLYDADIFLIPKNNAETLIKQGLIRKEKLVEFNEKLFQVDRTEIGDISNNAIFMSMFKVPKDAIKSVSFGCRAEASFKETVIKKLTVSSLNGIKIFDAFIDKYDYRLRFNKIDT